MEWQTPMLNALRKGADAGDFEDWIELSKGTVYDFSNKDRKFNYKKVTDWDVSARTDHNDYLAHETIALLSYHSKGKKSWAGSKETFLKNVNAMRYRKIEWDSYDKAEWKANSTKHYTPPTKSKASKDSQNVKRRVATGEKHRLTRVKNAKLVMLEFCENHIKAQKNQSKVLEAQALAHLEAEAYIEEEMEWAGVLCQDMEVVSPIGWGSQRQVDGKKWWKGSKESDVRNKIRKTRKIEAKKSVALGEKYRKEALLKKFHLEMGKKRTVRRTYDDNLFHTLH